MLFRLDDVVKTYGPVTALDHLSLSAPTGAVGLLGPNGAGKTTLIRTLLGLIRLDQGAGEVLGRDIRRDQLMIRQQVGFVPEDECLFPSTTGVEFVAYAGELCGMGRRDAMQRAHEVLDYSGLDEQRYRPVDSYSTGMKQKLKVAAAIVHDPKLLIMDEPTNGLDPQGREDILRLARKLSHEKGMSLLFSSHLLPDVESVCDHILVIGRGKLLESGRIADLKERHDQLFQVRLKRRGEEFAARLRGLGLEATPVEDAWEIRMSAGEDVRILWQAARDAGAQIRHLRPRRSTLEEVFLKALRG